MQNLTGTVGDGGANGRHDVALVQALLVVTERPAHLDPARLKYLDAIDGDCGDRTKRALRQFQYDRVFVGPGGNKSQAVSGATAGLVASEDTTWKALTAAVPRELSDLRVLRGSKIVFVAATAAQRDASVTQATRLTFQPAFRVNVVAAINRLYENHGIVVGVCRDGDRRTFQTQYELLTSGRNVTSAGPGESNHNFGQAVDLGFAALRWLRPNGAIVENETSWLHQLDPRQRAEGESLIFWNLLRNTGTQNGLHRGPERDRPHLQNWSDAGIDMASRLAVLLTSAGRMRWSGRNQRYQCDLGFGGRFFDVGSAAEIWNRRATITVATLTQARAQIAQPAAVPTAVRGGAPLRARVQVPAVTLQDVAAMQASLREDFDAADRNWQAWRPR